MQRRKTDPFFYTLKYPKKGCEGSNPSTNWVWRWSKRRRREQTALRRAWTWRRRGTVWLGGGREGGGCCRRFGWLLSASPESWSRRLRPRRCRRRESERRWTWLKVEEHSINRTKRRRCLWWWWCWLQSPCLRVMSASNDKAIHTRSPASKRRFLNSKRHTELFYVHITTHNCCKCAKCVL